MQTVEIIRAKRDGEELSDESLQQLVDEYTSGAVTDYQMSAFLMAVFFQGMSARELGTWTMAMLRSGQVLDFTDIPGAKARKQRKRAKKAARARLPSRGQPSPRATSRALAARRSKPRPTR